EPKQRSGLVTVEQLERPQLAAVHVPGREHSTGAALTEQLLELVVADRVADLREPGFAGRRLIDFADVLLAAGVIDGGRALRRGWLVRLPGFEACGAFVRVSWVGQFHWAQLIRPRSMASRRLRVGRGQHSHTPAPTEDLDERAGA